MSGAEQDAITVAVGEIVERDLLPALSRYIAVPALSPVFDPAWKRTGAIDAAAELLAGYARQRPIASMSVDVIELEGRTPVVCCVIDRTDGGPATNTLIYGHLDKQPPLGAWRAGLDAFTAVREGDRLYGRGAADDGYALFTALAAIEAVERTGGQHGRIVVVIEASEESGSPDLDAHVAGLAGTIGTPDLIICLDSGCVTYDRLWVTTSLRGLVSGTLRIEVMREGVHSGHAGGITPSPSRIARLLLARIEDDATGDVTLEGLQTEVPPHRAAEIDAVTDEFGEEGAGIFPLLDGVELEGADARDRIERGTWKAAVSVIGAEGLPAIADAGNVALPSLALKLAVRIPPNLDATEAVRALATALTADPPFGAHVTFELEQSAGGWDAPPLDPSLADELRVASLRRFGQPPSALGLGGSIPFLGTLGERFPAAQLLATGVLGPESNAHGPNEFLHVPTVRALACTLADLLNQSADAR